MNYLHSPSRYHSNMNSKSPLSLFDSPSLTSNRFSDQYQALSCESPPPNFDDLQTPMPPQRRTLDWGTELIDKTAKSSPKGAITTDAIKTTPEQPSIKTSSSPFKSLERHTLSTTERMKVSPLKKYEISPLKKYEIPPFNASPMNKYEISPLKESPVNKYEIPPLKDSPLNKYEISPSTKKSITPQQHENTCPLNISRPTLLKYNSNTTEKLYKSSPLDQQDEEYSYRHRRPLEYISSPVRNTAPHDTISPRKSTSHHTLTFTPPPVGTRSSDKSPNHDGTYQQPSTHTASPMQQEEPVMYRSPVYSNSSYKPAVKRSKSFLDKPSPSPPTQTTSSSPPLPPPPPPPFQQSAPRFDGDYIHHREHLSITPLASRATQRKPSNIAPRSPVIRPHPNSLPHYMRSTESHQSRLQAQVDQQHHSKLHKAKVGGITKRARSPQQFRSSTKINAIDDIKNEMSPEDVYIPLAARVKLFEKGLGNGANSAHRPSNSDNTAWTHRLTKAKSPYLYTRERSVASSHHCHELPEPPSSLNDRLMQERINSQEDIRQNENKRLTKRSRHSSEDSTRIPEAKRSKHAQVKPFRFATDDRAARYQETFKAKLNLWKKKDDTDNQKKP